MAQRPAGDPKRRDEFRGMGRQVHDIVGGDAFLDALVEVERDESARGQLKANPKAHLQGKGLRIPDEMSVEFTEEPDWGIRLSVTGEGGVRSGFQVRSGYRGRETDPNDRGEFKRSLRQVHDIVDSDAFIDANLEAASDERALAQLKANPRAYLQEKRSRIPDELEVEVTEASPHCYWTCWKWWCFRFCVYRCC